ncbi:PKD domain-containing protein [Propionicimonas paludicola]|nr:PKD domain-containing protein [Propionicimonas paludicola]
MKKSLIAAAASLGLVMMAAPAAQAAQLSTIAPVEPRSSSVVTAVPLPTAQIDSGVVWAVKVVGNTVYAGGKFTAARPAGSKAGENTVARSNLLSFNLTTGALNSFAPVVNGQIKALAVSPDGKRLYVGGTFSQVDGKTRWSIAAFDTATGALLETFKPAVGGSYVNTIVATNDVVYVGGLISAGNGVTRKNLMAFDAAGKLLAWAPTTDMQVDGMALTPAGDKVVVGGRFTLVNGVAQRGLVALSPSDGSIISNWIAPTIIKNGATNGKAGVYSITADADSLYATAWSFGGVAAGNLEGSARIDPDTGAITWMQDCHGDEYTAYSDGSNVYFAGHPHDCQTVGGYPQGDGSNVHYAVGFTKDVKGTLDSATASSTYSNWGGQPAPAMLNWYPDVISGSATGQGQGVWTLDGSGDYLVAGGEFPGINNKTQYGLVRFARSNVAGTTGDGPRLTGTNANAALKWTITAASPTAGLASVSVPINWDRDDKTLTYDLFRSADATTWTKVASKSLDSNFWALSSFNFVDNTAGLTPGQSYSYRVTATDSNGNVATSTDASVTISGTTVTGYQAAALADGAITYWPLGNGGATDLLGLNNGVAGFRVSTGTDPATGRSAARFQGGQSSSNIGSVNKVSQPQRFSLEGWFKTTTAAGKLFGFGSSQSGNSSSYDRHVYLSSNGALNFGVYTNKSNVISSGGGYADGKWHHVVATMDPTSGMALFVDGVQVASGANRYAQVYDGYWRIGSDSVSGWPNSNGNYFVGDVDEFAVYGTALTPGQVANHYAVGKGLTAPTASFTSAVTDLSATFTATASAGAGTITGYAWNFGDGQTGTGANPSHTYAVAGTYPVTLTVTDSNNLTGTASGSVTVTTPHAAPVADFSASASGLAVSVDASASTADGGDSLTYSWNWGDGTADGTGKTASHSYASPGDYTVTLTVTDDHSLTGTKAKTVSPTHAAPVASFTTTVDGLGVAVDASATTLSDSATASYGWDWGDGSAAGSGKTASHTYSAAGTYTVKLTVTDSFSATDTKSSTASVFDPADATVVLARFGTAVKPGWGAADKGGNWSLSGLSSSWFYVADGAGKIKLSKGLEGRATLDSVSVQDLSASASISLDALPVGGPVRFYLDLRRSADGSAGYRVRTDISVTGQVTQHLVKAVGGTETVLVSKTVSGLTYTPGDKLNLSTQLATSGGSTSFKAKVWLRSGDEPTSWTVSTTNGESALQGPGSFGVKTYTSGNATNTMVLSVDDVVVERS